MKHLSTRSVAVLAALALTGAFAGYTAVYAAAQGSSSDDNDGASGNSWRRRHHRHHRGEGTETTIFNNSGGGSVGALGGFGANITSTVVSASGLGTGPGGPPGTSASAPVAASAVAAVKALTEAEVAKNLLGYEGFNYTAGATVAGQGGGKGFAEPWVASGFNVAGADDYSVAEGSLTYPGIPSTGNRLVAKSRGEMQGVMREIAPTFQQRDGGTRYLAFLIRPDGALSGGNQNSYFGIGLANGRSTELFFGKGGSRHIIDWVLETRGGGTQQSSGVDAKTGETALIIVRADYADGSETYRLYVNPGAAEPESGPTLVFRGLVLPKLMVYSTGDFSLDEIRIGDTYASVAPKP